MLIIYATVVTPRWTPLSRHLCYSGVMSVDVINKPLSWRLAAASDVENEFCAADTSEWVRYRYAQAVTSSVWGFRRCPADIVNLIASDPSVRVRQRLAQVTWSEASDVQEKLAHDTHVDVRLNLAANTRSAEVISILVRDDDPTVRAAVAKYATDDNLAVLLSDEDSTVRAAAALSHHRTPEHVEIVATDSDLAIRREIAHYSQTSAAALHALAVDDRDEETRIAIARHRKADAQTLAMLATDDRTAICIEVLRNDNTPGDVIIDIAHRMVDLNTPAPNTLINRLLASHNATPHDVLLTLAMSPHKKDIRSRVARNTAAPHAIAAIAEQGNAQLRKRMLIAFTETRQQRMPFLATVKPDSVRMALAANPALPTDVATTLACDDNSQVRVALARRHDLPADVTATLVNDSHVRVTCALAANASLPADTLTEIYRLNRSGVRALLARNPHSSAALIQELADSASIEVACGIASRTHLDETVALHLIHNGNWRVYEAMVDRPYVTATIAAALAEHADSNVRAKVARLPVTDVETLTQLCTDTSRQVRKAVLTNDNVTDTMKVVIGLSGGSH